MSKATLIRSICSEKRLKPFIYYEYEESGVRVDVDLLLKKDDYVGVKVDAYYNKSGLQRPPKSVDFVIVVDCVSDKYRMYIIELKGTKQYTRAEINQKFETTIEQFIKTEFKDIFLNDRYAYKDISLYLVSNRFGNGKMYKNHEEYAELLKKTGRLDRLNQELNLSQRMFRIRNHVVRIKREIPPNPVIKRLS